MRGLVGIAALLLGACDERDADPGPSAAAPAIAEATPPGASPAPPPLVEASATPARLELPLRFTALGTEPFWAAKVDGDRLTYLTPEDQVGQPVAVARTERGDSIEIAATLAGTRLILTVSAGPCSDGMSDTVYPFAVRRRLGDDEQRGCAKPG